MRAHVLTLGLGALLGAAVTGLLAQSRQQVTQRVPQFENDEVKVWKTVIMPNSPLTMHRHEHGRALIALKGGKVTIVKNTGDEKNHDWDTGKAYWLDADPPGNELHADVNKGTEPIEVIVVELKNDRRR